jgi:hypothetical protein
MRENGYYHIQWALDDEQTMYLCSKYYISTDQNSNSSGEAGDEHDALRQQSHTKIRRIYSINAIYNFGTSPKDQDYAQRRKRFGRVDHIHRSFVGSNSRKYKPDEKGNDDGGRKLKTTGSKDYWIIWPIFEIYQSRHISINPKLGNGSQTYLSLKISFNFRALNSFLAASPPSQWDHRHPLFNENFPIGGPRWRGLYRDYW